jgi:hypothetical protein
MRGAADRDLEDPWQLSDGSAASRPEIEEDGAKELALLAYAQRSAARSGAEWFAAEFARREEDEQTRRRAGARWEPGSFGPAPTPQPELVDASVEDSVVGGAPAGLGIAPPPPAIRHPDVPRPPAPPPAVDAKRRRWGRAPEPETADTRPPPPPGWARMSPGARLLYGVDDADER